jgi:IclR family transcriptional regulator, KDG regulon repressor
MMAEVTSVQSVDRALMILDILQENPSGYGVTELANRLDVSKSTVHRLLMSLLKKNFVQQNKENDKYSLGLKLIEYGQAVSENLDVRRLASPYLHKLAQSMEETAHLVIPDQQEIVYIDKIESSQTIRMFSKVGKRAPMHCTGVGKAILAFLPEHQIEDAIRTKGLRKFTEKTLSNRDDLLQNLNLIRSRGFSIDDEEHETGIKCAAAPIFNHNGEVVAGISVAGPIMRVTEDKLERMAEEVLHASSEISRLLGAKV